MARYVTAKDSSFQDSFINVDEAQSHTICTFGAKLKNGQLCDKNGNRRSLKEIFEDNAFELKSLKNIIGPHGIAESEVTNVHIEDGQFIILPKIQTTG